MVPWRPSRGAEDGENWREGREEKERGCDPRVKGDERETGVEEAFWGGPERVGKEPERLVCEQRNFFFNLGVFIKE